RDAPGAHLLEMTPVLAADVLGVDDDRRRVHLVRRHAAPPRRAGSARARSRAAAACTRLAAHSGSPTRALLREPAALHHVDVLRERPHRGEVVICPTVFRGLSDESGFWKNDLDTPMLLGRPAAEWAERGDADTAQI